MARRRRRRLMYGAVVAALLVVPLLWVVDRTGPHAEVDAEVVRTRLWRHRPPDGRPHTHSDATLLIQGLNEVIVRRADTLEKGEWVRVLVRPGRLSGWPYFVGLAADEEPAAPPEAEPVVPAGGEEPASPEPEGELEPEAEPSAPLDSGEGTG